MSTAVLLCVEDSQPQPSSLAASLLQLKGRVSIKPSQVCVQMQQCEEFC